MAGDETGGRVALTEILRALSSELHAMGQTAELVQTTLAPALMAVAADPAGRRDAQACDRLTQRLFGAAAFVAALGPHVNGGWMVDPSDASRVVTLADLAHRLSCTTVIALEHEVGELEVF